MTGLDGARVVVTGAGGGLGCAIVRAFGAAGARVVACDLDGVRLEDPAIVEAHAFDLTDAAATADASARILEGGTPDVLVSNAGRTRAETMHDVDPSVLAAEMAGNFTGAAGLTLHLLPAMRALERGGAMVFVASVNAQAHFGNPAYSAAKAALLGWMRALAVEEGRHGLRANAVCPGSIRTNAWELRLAQNPRVLDEVSRLYPLGRIVTPAEVAQAVVFLASPLASGITGTALNVDAGLMAGNLPFIAAITREDASVI